MFNSFGDKYMKGQIDGHDLNVVTSFSALILLFQGLPSPIDLFF
jgi:hypothetical protein